MSYKTAFKDIMRVYEKDREHAAALLKERREEIYNKLPRVKEIDSELSQAGIGTARRILSESGESQTLIDNLRMHSANLKEEKRRILSEEGVPDGYFTDIYRCKSCQDTGYIDSTKRCQCLTQHLIEKYYDLSNIRDLLKTENFDTFEIKYYSSVVDPLNGISPRQKMDVIYKISKKFVDEFDQVFQNLLFYGATGLGKTFLCNCIAKELLDKGYTVLYITAPRIFRMIEDYRFSRNETEDHDYAVDAVTDVDLLILDDLGAEFGTVVTSAALFDIINQRLLARKPTVISTNLTPAEFEIHYSDRIVSRFLGHYKMTKFFGEDIRGMLKNT